jgi:hypothetical protein
MHTCTHTHRPEKPNPLVCLCVTVVLLAQASAYPPTSRPCNRVLCPSALATWRVGPWSVCTPASGTGGTQTTTAPCAGGTGRQTRDVSCRSATGAVLPDAACVTASPNTTMPTTTAVCTLAPTCVCHSDNDCPDSHWACNAATNTCGCSASWAGPGCDVPLLPPSTGASACSDGIVDVHGACCQGFIDAGTGACCPQDTAVDAQGRCCSAASGVDVCGVCGGLGRAVDVTGRCCSTPLLPSGLCCSEGTPDSCGVCGGLNQCP